MSPPLLQVYQNGLGAVGADALNTFVQSGGATVPVLRSFVGATGNLVTIVGFNAPNDGGFGTFYWNATAVNPVDDGGVTTVVPPAAATGCWTRLSLTTGLSTSILTVPNVAALKAIPVGSLSNNLAILVEGYYSPNDGGGGFFIATNSLPGTVDNGIVVASSSTGWWFERLVDGFEEYNVLWFGAYNNGANSATTFSAIQTCANSAAAAGNNMFAPGGVYDLRSSSSALSLTCGLRGIGYDISGPIVYGYGSTPANVDTRSSGFTNATVFMIASGSNGFNWASNDSYAVEKIFVTYPSGGSAETTAITLNAAAGNVGCNMGLVVRDVAINNAYTGLAINNSLDYVVDNANFTSCYLPIVCSSTNAILFTGVTSAASAGDPTICNSTFFNTKGGNHIQLLTGAGHRIVNNKGNYSLSDGSTANQAAVLISPQNIGILFSLVPGVVANNSFEGSAVALLFSPNAASSGSGSLWAITGNEFLCTVGISIVEGTEIPTWMSAITITGNTFGYGNPGPSDPSTLPCIILGGVSNSVISGNLLAGSNPSAEPAITQGSGVSNLKICGNHYIGTAQPPGVLTPESIPSSGTNVTNTTGYVCSVGIEGGTVSSVRILPFNFASFVTVATATNVVVMLNPGEVINVTYSSTPTWVWLAVNP